MMFIDNERPTQFYIFASKCVSRSIFVIIKAEIQQWLKQLIRHWKLVCCVSFGPLKIGCLFFIA